MNVQTVERKVTVGSSLNTALEALAVEGNNWGPLVTIDQNMVDTFTALTGDNNPMHKVGTRRNVVVPGLLILGLLPKLSPLSRRTEIDGRAVVNLGASINFLLPVFVGKGIRMRYTLMSPKVNDCGVLDLSVRADFDIGLEPLMKTAAVGEIKLKLLSPKPSSNN